MNDAITITIQGIRTLGPLKGGPRVLLKQLALKPA